MQISGLTPFEFTMRDIRAEFGDIGGQQIFLKAWVTDYFWYETQNGTAVTQVYDDGVRWVVEKVYLNLFI